MSYFPQMLFNDCVSLVTGGGSGIGFEISYRLGLHGSKIIILGRDETKLKLAIKQLSDSNIVARYVVADIRNEVSCEKAITETIEAYGKLDILINNAGGIFLCPAEKLSSNGFKSIMEIDTLGTFHMSKAAFTQLCKSKNASIINISATMHYPASWYLIHACAAKSAIDSMTRTLCLEWDDYNIRVNGVAPGLVMETVGYDKTIGLSRLNVNDGESFAEPLQTLKVVSKQDVANVVLFLASPLGKGINGQVIVVDAGGVIIKKPLTSREHVSDRSKAQEHVKNIGSY